VDQSSSTASVSFGNINDALINQIVQFGYETRFETLPSHVPGEAKRLLLDSIGCALGAMTVEKGRRSIAVAKEIAGPARNLPRQLPLSQMANSLTGSITTPSLRRRATSVLVLDDVPTNARYAMG
jgi:hypothetical protein